MAEPNPTDSSEKRRVAFKQVLDNAGMSPADAARAAGMSSANSIYNFLSGRSKSLSADTLERLAKVIPGVSGDTIPMKAPLPDGVRTVSIRMQAKAGYFRPEPELPLDEQRPVAATVPPGYGPLGMFGVTVAAPGAENLYPTGSLLLCVPIERYESDLAHGNRVLVEHTVQNQVEVTVRELILRDGKAFLWPRSTDPAFQLPTEMPWPWAGRPWSVGAGDRFRLTAVVVFASTPQV